MMIYGYGVPKNHSSAFCLLDEIYGDLKNLFSKEEFTCSFADVALRVGKMYENGYGTDQNYELAYYFYLQAKLAIGFRVETDPQYGDTTVKKNVEDAIKRVEEKLTDDFYMDLTVLDNPSIIGKLMDVSYMCDITLHQSNGIFYMDVNGFYADDDRKKYALITLPRMK